MFYTQRHALRVFMRSHKVPLTTLGLVHAMAKLCMGIVGSFMAVWERMNGLRAVASSSRFPTRAEAVLTDRITQYIVCRRPLATSLINGFVGLREGYFYKGGVAVQVRPSLYAQILCIRATDRYDVMLRRPFGPTLEIMRDVDLAKASSYVEEILVEMNNMTAAVR